MFRYLDYAFAVYEERSFTKAAKQLCISQPALSATIKKLEDTLGHPVFDRSGKQVTLTDAGMRYIRAAEQIRQIRQNLEQELDDLAQLRRGSILLGSTTYIVSNVMTHVLKSFGRRYPDIEVKILVEQSTVLQEKLEQGLVDFAIDNALSQEPDYEYIPLFREHILLGVPSDLPINDRYKDFQLPVEALCRPDCDYSALPKIDISAFAAEEFVLLKPGNKMRQIANNLFGEKGVTPKIRFQFDQMVTSISFAESGFGICLLSDTILQYVGPGKNLTYYQTDSSLADRHLYVIHKKNKYLSSASREFIGFLQESFQK